MKFSILHKLIVLSSSLLLGIGFISYAVYISNKKLTDSDMWVKHTENVIALSGTILLLGKDIETSSRGYVITKDSSFLTPLFMAKKSMFNYVRQLKKLVWDNPVQLVRVDSLNVLIQKRLDFSYRCLDARNTEGLDKAIALVVSKQGKYYSEKLNKVIREIQQTEKQLLKERKNTSETNRNSFNSFTVTILVLMTVFTVLLIIVVGSYWYQTKEKEKQQSELIRSNAERFLQETEKNKQIEANKELEAFSYSVSHDLRAPLRHIGGFVDLLLKNNAAQLDETGVRYLNTISESSHEVGHLIDALLTFSRLSRTELNRSVIHTKNMVARIVQSCKDELKDRNIKINVHDLKNGFGDENLINQVWVNLISNAIKYTKNNSVAVIEINSKVEDHFTIFSIKDNGAGFNMKYVDKLFGVFQRLHKSRDFEGVGIGLANVKRIISRHGGTCWAEAEVDKGATFHFSLPNV